MKSAKILNRILWATEYWFQTLKCQIWLTNKKPFCGKVRETLKPCRIFFLVFEFSYKYVLKSVNSVNWIFWVTEYCLKALKWKIWLMKTKPFIWDSETKLETLQKLSSHIWIFYKFVLKSVNSLSRIFWATEYWLKALNAEVGWRI